MNNKNDRMSVCFLLAFFGIIAFFVLLSSCSNSTPGGYSGTAQTSIAIRDLPPSISSITLTISADDMETIPPIPILPTETSLTVELPAGPERLFEMEITPTPESVFLRYYGSATEDLVAGEEADVTIPMELMETRLVIPDADHYAPGGRIVQIDDMTGAGWVELDGTDLGFAADSEFVPYDIDYDEQGRIYIANNYASTGPARVIRIDSFQDTIYDEIVSEGDVSGSGVNCIAIDSVNNYIYYSTGGANWPIYRKSLGPPLGTQEAFNIGSEELSNYFQTTGLSVDSDGFLYIVNTDAGNYVHKYDISLPAGSRIVQTYSTNLNVPWDTLVFGDYIIVSNRDGAAGYKFIVLDKDMNFINNFGSYPAVPANPVDNEFYGPERFVAVLNKKITVVDETVPFVSPSYNQLVSFDDIYGNGWTSFGSTGNGIGQFYFYSTC